MNLYSLASFLKKEGCLHHFTGAMISVILMTEGVRTTLPAAAGIPH